MPCEGVTGIPLFFFGARWQHSIAPILRDKFTNTTVVDNWDTSVGAPATIPPYERWTPDLSPGSCDVHHCVDGGAPCAAWVLPLVANTFSHTPGDQVNFSVMHKKGFKNVQASRCWNGRFGYLDIESSGANDTWIPCDSGASAVAYRSAKTSALQTRYTQIDISASWEWVHNEWDGPPESTTPTTTTKDQSASVTQVITHGILNTTALALTPNTSQDEPLGEFPQNAFAALAIGFKHFGNVVSDMIAGTITDVTSFAWTATSYTQSNSFQVETITWDIGAGTFNRTVQQNFPDGGGYLNILVESYTLSETSLSYSKVEYNRIGDPGPAQGMIIDQKTTTVTGTLSGAISAADIYADIKTLLSQWDLTDDALYPWRTDLKVNVAPLVNRDELLTTEFDSTGFYLRNYGVPVVDPLGNTIGDPDWEGNTGYTLNPNPQTGTYRTAIDFAGHNSATPVDIQITPNFPHTKAAVTYTVIGGSFPPGVSMDAGGHITGPIGDDGHYGVTIEASCGIAAASGVILGGPKPAGYQDYFDFRFADMRGCCQRPGDGSQTWEWYQLGWGQSLSTFNSNTGCGLPLNATQWNNWFQAINKPAGAWIFYADKGDYFGSGCVSSTGLSGAGDAGNVVAQKWAEILDLWPSQNFAMPAGDAKFWFDETRVCCATNVSGSGVGSVWALIDSLTGVAPVFIIGPDDYWGGPCVGGFYQIAGWDGTNVTLGAKKFDVPSNWKSKSDVGAIDLGSGAKTDADFCFGPLRWIDKPSLLGRVAITPHSDLSCTLASPQPAFGMDSATHQEQIDIYDASMTLIVANTTATRVDDSNFSLDTFYPNAAWIQIHGSPKYYMNDGNPKGDFVKLDWTSDFRSFNEAGRLNGINGCDGVTPIGGGPTTNAGGGPIDSATQFASFNQTQCCLPFVPCAPKVVCITPNGESFANGHTYDFPLTFALDEAYGSKWWGYILPIMTDLFWQQPHRPCNIATCARWIMDGGTCAENVEGFCPGDDGYVSDEETPPPIYYFAHAPQVEARLSVPSSSDFCSHAYGPDQNEGGPALPASIQIGWLSPVTNITGDVALPPTPPGVTDDGTPGGYAGPWELHRAMCEAAVGGCRFNYTLPGCDS